MNDLNILIVEDESLVAMELSHEVTSLGYNVVDYATNSRMAKNFFEKFDINLIIMDVNLSEDSDGIDLYESFDSNVDVIYITAYKDEDTISKAILTKPVGYLVKPHNEYELQALLKMASAKINHIKVKKKLASDAVDLSQGYVFNIQKGKLFFNDIEIGLSFKELKLLKLLIKNRGKLVTYNMIEEEVWGNETVNNTSLRTLIYRLRSKLEHKLIESVFKNGIRLNY